MLSPRRRDPTTTAAAAADQFTFSNPIRTDPDPSKAVEYERWAEKIKGKYNYFGRLEDVKYGAWTRKATKSDSDTPSPELWGEGRPSVRSAESSPVRTGRQEMLELVKDVPESAYELSLIDMVELTRITRADEDTKSKKKREKKGKKKSMGRSESLETGGLMLKMFTPRVPVGSPCRRQSFGVSSGKVSPTRGGVGEGEKWWSRNSSGTSSTGSSNSSGSSAGNASSLRSRIVGSCYPFITHKGKSGESED